MTFLNKIMVAKKYIFSNAQPNFAKDKVISNVKMINLEKIK